MKLTNKKITTRNNKSIFQYFKVMHINNLKKGLTGGEKLVEQSGKQVYCRPICHIINVASESFICAVSVRPNSSLSYEESWGTDQEHSSEDIFIGDASEIAP